MCQLYLHEIGGLAHTLRLFNIRIHSSIFSGMVHLRDHNILNFCFGKESCLDPEKSRQKQQLTKLAFLLAFSKIDPVWPVFGPCDDILHYRASDGSLKPNEVVKAI